MKRPLCILIIFLIWIPFVFAKETFYSALESKESVEKEGGTIDGGNFAEGKFGNGFVSEENGDVIHFPVKDRFVNLEEGTVELWVKMGLDTSDITSSELFLFMTYKRGTDAIFLGATLNNNNDVDKGWRVESRLPWSDMKVKGSTVRGKTMGWNILYTDKIGGTSTAFSWSPKVNGFDNNHEAHNWGEITFIDGYALAVNPWHCLTACWCNIKD